MLPSPVASGPKGQCFLCRGSARLKSCPDTDRDLYNELLIQDASNSKQRVALGTVGLRCWFG